MLVFQLLKVGSFVGVDKVAILTMQLHGNLIDMT